MTKKVSMQQIADVLGLSKYAVSKTLAGKEGVSPQTRERIIEVASQFGYFKQEKIMSKKTGTIVTDKHSSIEIDPDKNTVAVLMPSVRHQTMDSMFWSMIVQGIGQALSSYGLGMIIITEQTTEQFSIVLKPDRLLGVIGVGEISTSMLLELNRLGLPFVLTDHEDCLVPCDSVFASNLDSMSAITAHLHALGHRSFWFLGDIKFSRSFKDRWMGFRMALEEKNISTIPDEIKLSLPGADRSVIREKLMFEIENCKEIGKELPTAWVCANDEIALTALRVLEERGVNVPLEISITGFDNIDESQRISVPLTTVNVQKEELGKRAVSLLMDRISFPSKPYEKINLSCELVLQLSSSPAPLYT